MVYVEVSSENIPHIIKGEQISKTIFKFIREIFKKLMFFSDLNRKREDATRFLIFSYTSLINRYVFRKLLKELV
jgi:hypothetical protein